MFARLLLLGSSLALAASAMAAPADQVTAADGATYVGNTSPTGRQFLGIRYAQPPLGKLRWVAPQPLGVTSARQSAQALPPRCVQPTDMWNFNPKPGDAMQGSEDCLFLNIYTPRVGGARKPVMVWIHGGGFVTGAGGDYDPHLLAERQDVIVVTINYRLGALGFLSHPSFGDESGNFGLLDQQMALRWLQRNVSAFGGDPAKLTIFGESAGGVSVCAQLKSPGAAGLFSRAIIESGPCVAFPRAMADEKGRRFATAAGCTGDGPDAIECLRALPAWTAAANTAGDVGIGDTPWALVQGTRTLPDDPAVLERGAFNRVPVLNGSNLDEGRLFALTNLARLGTRDAYVENLKLAYGERAPAVLAAYPPERYPSAAMAYANYITDWLFACPALSANTAMAQHTPVYAYEFADRDAPAPAPRPETFGSLGAFHASEIQYIFQTPSALSGPATFSPAQQRLADRLQRAWAAFASTGNPSIAGEPAWEPVLPGRDRIRILDTSAPRTTPDFAARHRCAFWNAPAG